MTGVIKEEEQLHPEEALSLGYRRLTSEYSGHEDWMLSNVISDMVRGKIDFCLVKAYGGVSVWRRGMRLLEEEEA